MDLSMLNKLQTANLLKMKAHIDEVLASRLDTSIAWGRTATFLNSRTKSITKVRIEGMNRTTVSCVEIEPTPGKKWRIPPGMLTVEPVERRVAKPMNVTIAHKPASAAAETW